MQVKFNQPFNQAMNREREIAANWFNTVHYKGRVMLPNWMNFRKSSKGKGGHFQSKNLYCRFGNLKQGLLSIKLKQKSNFRVQVIP